MEIVFELLTSDKEEYIIKTPIRQGFCNDVWIKEVRKARGQDGRQNNRWEYLINYTSLKGMFTIRDPETPSRNRILRFDFSSTHILLSSGGPSPI